MEIWKDWILDGKTITVIILRCTIVYCKEEGISLFLGDAFWSFQGWDALMSETWEEKIEENTVCGAAYWQGTHEALPFCKRTALQSRPTEPHDLHSRALGPASPDSGLGTRVLRSFLIWRQEPLLCVPALAFLSGGAAGTTQAARENAAPHPELLISYKQWGRKGGPSYGWIQPGSADKLFWLPNKLVMINHTTESS